MNYDASPINATTSAPPAVSATVFETHLPALATLAPHIPIESNVPVVDLALPEIVEDIETISSELELVFIIFEQPIATRLLYQLSGS
jgi:hypothetical protein